MKAFNINIAGDFLVMASTLIHIKSRMLLPEQDQESEEDDPRTEITRPLMEYLRLKEVASELSEREMLDRDVFKRHLSPDYFSELEGEGSPLLDVSLFQLIDAFKKIVEQKVPDSPLTFRSEKWTVKDRTAFIIERLKENAVIYFKDLFAEDRTISELIVTFLALLELVRRGADQGSFSSGPDDEIRLEAHFKDNGEENNV